MVSVRVVVILLMFELKLSARDDESLLRDKSMAGWGVVAGSGSSSKIVVISSSNSGAAVVEVGVGALGVIRPSSILFTPRDEVLTNEAPTTPTALEIGAAGGDTSDFSTLSPPFSILIDLKPIS